MKVLAPAVTCVLVSHMKPPYLGEAIGSAVNQTRRDIAIVVADSGQWIGQQDQASADMAAVYAKWSKHPLVEWVTTGEPPNLAVFACPVAWATNQVIRAGLVRGRYMCTFYDDDLYYPKFMEAMAGQLDGHPEQRAVYCSQKTTAVGPDGMPFGVPGMRLAMDVRGPGGMDCQLDGGQVMWRTDLLDVIGDPWLPEEPGNCHHSDGLFLERIAQVAGAVWPVPGEILCENRKTPLSAFTPSVPR